MKKTNRTQEVNFAIIAALIVLFSAMWNPMTSVIVTIAALVLYGVYKFMQK